MEEYIIANLRMMNLFYYRKAGLLYVIDWQRFYSKFFLFYLVISEPFLGDVKQFIPGVMINLQQTCHRLLLAIIKKFIALQNMHKILLKMQHFTVTLKL